MTAETAETEEIEEKKKSCQRKVKLIKPGLQLKLVGAFVGMTALTLLLQYVLIAAHLTDAATRMPDGGTYLMSAMPEMLTKVLLLSFLVVLPMMFCVGVLTTFRIAGPVYRFEQYLGQVARGEESGPCRIRKGDELWDLCDKINEATAAMRHRELVASGAAEAEAEAPAEEPLRKAG